MLPLVETFRLALAHVGRLGVISIRSFSLGWVSRVINEAEDTIFAEKSVNSADEK